jgi:hypothetical protein
MMFSLTATTKARSCPWDDPLQQLRHGTILFRNTIPLAFAYVIDHSKEQGKIRFRPEAVDFSAHSIDLQPKVINVKIFNRPTACIADRGRHRHESGGLAKHGRILRKHCRCQQKGKQRDSETTPHRPVPMVRDHHKQ